VSSASPASSTAEAARGTRAGRRARLSRLRQTSQLVFLAAFVLLLASAVHQWQTGIPPDLFLRADPLVALSAALSVRQAALSLLWFAVPIVVLSLVLGRVFCGWVCPMGTTLDLCERALRIRGRRPEKALSWRRVKFYVLAALVVTMLLPVAQRTVGGSGLRSSTGLAATYLVDPIALLTRTFTWAAVPVAQGTANASYTTLNGYLYSDFATKHPLAARLLGPFYDLENPLVRPVYFRLGLAVFLMFAGIVALGLLARRFWCRNLCPLGALLGVLGKWAPVRLRVSERCNRCRRCALECKTGAIPETPHGYLGPECIACYRCVDICPQQAISVGVGYGAEREDAVRLDRRRLLGAAGVGLAAAVLPRVDWTARGSGAGNKVLKVSSERLVRPPGAKVEAPFVSACVRCGECMAACPNNALQPALGEGGLEALGTPILAPRIGPCLQNCAACGTVCPVRAIEPFTVEEKTHLYMGTAYVDRSRCIAWADGKKCLVCDEACSYDAISQQMVEGVPRPVVNPDICVGCGMCEYVCPIEPLGAIHVSALGDQRHLSREEQQARREAAEARRAGPAETPGEAESPYPGT
jgi:polyferredoxin